jgi:UDP-glucose 4-epimerase
MKKKNTCVLITGGCGFVGRNLIKHLGFENDIWVIDDLSIGKHPDTWLRKLYTKVSQKKNYVVYSRGKQRIHVITADLIDILSEEIRTAKVLPEFATVYHFASIVGGRELIDGDPILVGKDLAIDSMFFHWLTRNNRNVNSVLYASSSAAYPTMFQGKKNFKALKETDIDFTASVGMPDMTYGWSKLTGEYLSRLAASRYSLPICCVRPFSGYGEDQDFSYPIPAIAQRVARKEDPLTVWGTGKQSRDFVHIDDCIDAFFVIMKNIRDGSACNIGSGNLTSFLDVIKIFTHVENYNPKIIPLGSKPVGVSSRFADTSLITSFGWKPKISNEDGFSRVLNFIHTYRL